MPSIFIIPLLLLAILFPVSAGVLSGFCTGVSDGDTITLLSSRKEQVKVRLHGIDAPERRQDFGQEARQKLAGLVRGKEITVHITSQDRYGRSIGKVYAGKLYINREMVRCGLAWHYVRYAPDDADLARAEKEARAGKSGLWSQATHIPPWQWRRRPKPAAEQPPAPTLPATRGCYWISGTGKIHNSTCRHYGSTTKGIYTPSPQGENCRICGGAAPSSPEH